MRTRRLLCEPLENRALLTVGVTNLGLNAVDIQLDGNLGAFLVDEQQQGNTDLNGDGDTWDAVLHVYDAPEGGARVENQS
jgi:hypothetical protein